LSQYFINPSSFGVPIPPVVSDGSWTEIGRTTLGAPGDDITVSGLPNKEFYMILVDIFDSPDIQLNIRLGDGGVDSGANYASRDANNGTADVSRATQNQILLSVNSVTSLFQFGFGYINNLWGHEKLVSFRGGRWEDGVQLGNFRSQVAGKWSNLSPLDTININNAGTGSFPTGSELVVLGWSRFDPQLPNFWNLLGEKTAVGGEDIVITPNFTKRKYLWINNQVSKGGTSQFAYQGRFGDGTVQTSPTNLYDLRFANSSFADQLFSGTEYSILTSGNSNNYANFFFINKVGQEKAGIGQGTSDTSQFSPPNDIQRNMVSVRNRDLTLKAGQIDIASMFRFSGVQTIGAGSKITVWGND